MKLKVRLTRLGQFSLKLIGLFEESMAVDHFALRLPTLH